MTGQEVDRPLSRARIELGYAIISHQVGPCVVISVDRYVVRISLNWKGIVLRLQRVDVNPGEIVAEEGGSDLR